jgi:hypothetical protein
MAVNGRTEVAVRRHRLRLQLWAGGSVSWRAARSELCQAARLTAGRMVEAGAASTRAAPRPLLQAARPIASRTAEAGATSTRAASLLLKTHTTAWRMAEATVASTRAAPRPLLQAARPTSDELTVLYSNGPDDKVNAPLHRARRRQAQPTRGLPHCCSRHAPLRGAWWGQTVSAQGLLQVGSRRHGALHLAWRRQAVPARAAAPRELKAAARPTARRMEVAGGVSRRAAPSQSRKLPAARSARYVCGAHSLSPTVWSIIHPLGTTWHEREAPQRLWRTSHKPVHG